MPQVLELPQLLKNHGKAKVDIRSRGIDSEFDPEGPTPGEAPLEFAVRKAINGVSGQPGRLLGGIHADRGEGGEKSGAPVEKSIRRNARLRRPAGTYAVAFPRLALAPMGASWPQVQLNRMRDELEIVRPTTRVPREGWLGRVTRAAHDAVVIESRPTPVRHAADQPVSVESPPRPIRREGAPRRRRAPIGAVDAPTRQRTRAPYRGPEVVPAPPGPREPDPPDGPDTPRPARRWGGGPPWRSRWRRGRGDDGAPKPRLRKLRFLLILIGLAILALISTVFGMMMAVASDLPQLENTQEFATGQTSYLYDDQGRPIGPLLSPDKHEVIDSWKQISPWMIDAIISIEDKRFWSDPGVDIRSVIRAAWSDVTGGATQGASTIAEQFVKNTLKQEDNRTIFEKLREAALAFQLTQKWSKVKILTEYLNSIYFGNGAWGVESAARVYFGEELGYDPNAPADGHVSRCGDSTRGHPLPSCASLLQPWQAALLAGMVANPSAFDPVANPSAAAQRRDLALSNMFQQGYLSHTLYVVSKAQPLPTKADLQQPEEPSAAPYFTSWLRPQILRAMGYGHGVSQKVADYRAYYGGLKIKTTLDLRLQQAADQAIAQDFPFHPGGPAASLVAIDNRTGQVRAMVGGPIVNGKEDYQQYPFNLATQGQRQPGSAFKPFTLAVALEAGYTPNSVFLSAPAQFVVPNSGGKEIFRVRNFGNSYSGPITLQEATDISDNSVFSRLGIDGLAKYGGTKRIARLAERMGIRTPVSHNYAMILGGLKVGVSPLDMAHAYESIATLGRKIYDPVLGDVGRGPTGIAEIQCPKICPRKVVVDHPRSKRVLPVSIAQTEYSMLEGPVQSGTATAAQIPGVVVAGKTGTTTNYADAWFVGWTPQLTVAVWVGYPNGNTSMSTLYNGGPVEGGTFPAIIWHDFMVQALGILSSEQAAAHQGNSGSSPSVSSGGGSGSSGGGSSGSGSGSSGGSGRSGGGQNSGGSGSPPNTSAGGGRAAGGGNNGTSTPAAGGGGHGGQGTTAPRWRRRARRRRRRRRWRAWRRRGWRRRLRRWRCRAQLRRRRYQSLTPRPAGPSARRVRGETETGSQRRRSATAARRPW